jgi:hypothetical protein
MRQKNTRAAALLLMGISMGLLTITQIRYVKTFWAYLSPRRIFPSVLPRQKDTLSVKVARGSSRAIVETDIATTATTQEDRGHSMTKRKTKPNRTLEFRKAFAYTKGVDDAKRTISSHVWRRSWLRGFALGIMVGTLATCVVLLVAVW